MQSQASSSPTNSTNSPHLVATVVYDALAVFEFSIAYEIFGRPRPELEIPWYRFESCAIEAGPLHTGTGLSVLAPESWGTLDNAQTIIIPGWRNADEKPPERLLDSLRRAHGRGCRLVSICSGVFVLAAAGLLDGRRATTHWHYAQKLRNLYPKVRVHEEVLYVSDDGLFTSAGSAAGIDLGLHLIRQDHGTAMANHVARRLVMPAHRDGGQSQFIPSPIEGQERNALAPLLDWIDEHLQSSLTSGVLARQAAMSERTLTRRFKEKTGMTPLRFVNRRRVEIARGLLEDSDWSVEQIAHKVGFGSGQMLRLHFRRSLGTTPQRYRDSFNDSRP